MHIGLRKPRTHTAYAMRTHISTVNQPVNQPSSGLSLGRQIRSLNIPVL